MRKRIKWLFPLLLTLNMGVQAAILQQDSHSEPSVPQIPGGIWEAPDGNGGFIGVNLWEVPASLGHGGPAPKNDEPDRPVLQIGVFQRSNARVRCGEENFFDTGWRGPLHGSSSCYAHELLRVHYPATAPHDIPIDLELTFDPKNDVWKCHFHRGAFDANVTLNRAQNRPSHDQELCVGRPAPDED
jgi:hypothetical protein